MELQAFLETSESEWVMAPALWELAKRWQKLLPAGLDEQTVRAFYAKLGSFGPFRPFTATQRPEYFRAYLAERIAAAREAFANDVSQGFVSETAYLFGCRDEADMVGFSHLRGDDVDRIAVVSRQKLIDVHQRFVSARNFKVERFAPLVDDEIVLDGARRTLANPWFLDRMRREEATGHATGVDTMLWIACKLVLMLANEPVSAPGPGPAEPVQPIHAI